LLAGWGGRAAVVGPPVWFWRAREGSRDPRSPVWKPKAAAVTSAGEAAAVPSAHGGQRRTASQREHQEGGEEEDLQPTVPISCGAGHDHTPEATTVPGQKALSLRALRSSPDRDAEEDADMSALADMSSPQAVDRKTMIRGHNFTASAMMIPVSSAVIPLGTWWRMASNTARTSCARSAGGSGHSDRITDDRDSCRRSARLGQDLEALS
jgi:hypothetical protein